MFDLADGDNQNRKFCGSNRRHGARASTERKTTRISEVPGPVQ